MDLSEALYRSITGGRSPRTAGGSVPSMVADVRRVYPTTPPPGISEATWRRLRANPARGTTPRITAALRTAQRAARVTPARARMLRGSPIIGVHANVRVSSDERDRKILLSSWLTPGRPLSAGDQTQLMRDVLDQWLAGNEDQAAETFRSAMESGLNGRSGGRQLELLDVTEIRFWAPGPKNAQAADIVWKRR